MIIATLHIRGLTLVIAIALASACSPSNEQSPELRDLDTDAAGASDASTAPLVRVRAVSAVRTTRYLRASGLVEPSARAELAFSLPGTVAAVDAEEGQLVSRGQLLARLDATDARILLDQAALTLARADDELTRSRPLAAVGSIAPNDLARLETSARLASAARGLAAKRLADTRLISSLDGIVSVRSIERGESAAPGAPVFTVVSLDEVRVRAGFPESEIGWFRKGQKAEVRIAAFPERVFAGEVRLVGVEADQATRTFAVEVAIGNPGHLLRGGMVGEISLPDRAAEARDSVSSTLTVPASAIVRMPGGRSIVYTYAASERRVRSRSVTLGAVAGDGIGVQGLRAGELIVVAGQHRVRDGRVVRAIIEKDLPDVNTDRTPVTQPTATQAVVPRGGRS